MVQTLYLEDIGAGRRKYISRHGRCLKRVKMRNTQSEQMSSALPPTTDIR